LSLGGAPTLRYLGWDCPHAGHRLALMAVCPQFAQSVPPQCLHLIQPSNQPIFLPHAAQFVIISPRLGQINLFFRLAVIVRVLLLQNTGNETCELDFRLDLPGWRLLSKCAAAGFPVPIFIDYDRQQCRQHE
jgi:hypothetical protein